MTLDDLSTIQEGKHRRRGMTWSIVFHVALIVIALLPLMHFQNPPPGQEGILVNLGLPDQGQGDENAPAGEPAAAEPEPEPQKEEPKPEPARPEPVRERPQKAPEKEVIKTEDPEAVALRKKQQEEERQRREDELRRQREETEARQRQEAEAKARAEAEAKKKAEAEALKNSIGGAFGGGKGKGKGNTGKPGNQGDPNGDPNADQLEGISKGSGKVGGGLGSRGVVANPRPEDQSQATGTVVVEVCVDAEGNVLSAEFTQRGSTTANSELVRIAESNARRWRFSRGDVEKQCGTITYNFRLQ